MAYIGTADGLRQLPVVNLVGDRRNKLVRYHSKKNQLDLEGTVSIYIYFLLSDRSSLNVYRYFFAVASSIYKYIFPTQVKVLSSEN